MENVVKIQTTVYEAVIEEFNLKGLKFTMDDIAKRMGMSKKTLYQLFSDKEELFLKTIHYGFDVVKQSEFEILNNQKLDVIEKIRRIIIAMPERYRNVDFRKLSELRERYPKVYRQVEERIENDWDATLDLLKTGMEQGKIRKINLVVLKAMIEASIEHFLETTLLIEEKISYEEALNEMIEIIMKGIVL